MLVPQEQLLYPPVEASSFIVAKQDVREPQRVCQPCAAAVEPMQEQLRTELAKANQETVVDRSRADRYLNLPVQFDMEQEIRKATYVLYNFTSDNAIQGADSIPRELLLNAKGIAVLTIMRAGFVVSGRIGTGIVISRLPDRSWSAPSAICCTGIGWGFQIGGEITDVVIVLNTKAAVEAFASTAQVTLGTGLGVAIGPVGRTVGTDVYASDRGVTAAFSYAHSKGLFAGVSLEASVIVSRPDVNRAFYGQSVSPSELLRGEYPRPRAAQPLYQALAEVLSTPATSDASRPGSMRALPAAAAAAAAVATTARRTGIEVTHIGVAGETPASPTVEQDYVDADDEAVRDDAELLFDPSEIPAANSSSSSMQQVRF